MKLSRTQLRTGKNRAAPEHVRAGYGPGFYDKDSSEHRAVLRFLVSLSLAQPGWST